jgi:hypothetical protein
MGDENKEENDTHAQVEEGAEEDLEVQDDDAASVAGGRKAGENPLE